MFRHLFKLVWNKKKQNFLLMTEILLSFLVMFTIFTFLVYYYQNYYRPRGIKYENVWAINYSAQLGMTDGDSLSRYNSSLEQLIKSMPPVEAVTLTGQNFPFTPISVGTYVSYNKSPRLQANAYLTEDSYKDLLGVIVEEGRWFSKEDDAAAQKPVVINATLKEALFGKEHAVGKSIVQNDDHVRIVGVVADLKDRSDYQAPENGIFTRLDTASQPRLGAILVKVKPGTDAVFEGRLYNAVSHAMGNTSINIRHLSGMLHDRNSLMLVPMIILMVVAGFLVINVALGLFGILWYNIHKRRGEIGLRRAVGASGNSISKQLVGEALVLSTVSLAVGTFFAIQFPLLHVFNLPAGVYLVALVLSVAFIYLLVVICAVYPGKQAAAIYPAVALHED